jgi:hypothetical protein
MGTKKVRIGSVSLLFTVILLCVVVLSVLSISTVRADRALSERTAESVSDWYELQNEGQKWLAEVDAVLREHRWRRCDRFLPKGSVRDDLIISTELKHKGRTLQIKIRWVGRNPDGPRYKVVEWKSSVDWEEDQSMNLFL